MDTKRIIILAAIAFVAMQLWSAWQIDHRQTAPVSETHSTQSTSIPQEILSGAASHPNDTTINPAVLNLRDAHQENLISVTSDVLNLKIDPRSADIVYASLPQYSTALDKPNDPVVLLTADPKYQYVAQSTFIAKDSFHLEEAVYTTEKKQYHLAADQQQLTVDFSWKNPAGIEFIKRYTVKRGQYNILIQYLINNDSTTPWKGNLITQLSRTANDPNATKGFFNIHAYFGASISTQNDPYQKLTFSDIKSKKIMESSQGGWAAMQQHYFLSAWIPEQNQENLYYTHTQDNNLYTVGIRGPDLYAEPGTTATTQAQLYIGPELPENLKMIAPHLDMTVDYGWLWFISDILYWLLATMYSLIQNWGWAIIAVTVLIKLVFYPLSVASYRSMSKMRALQPKIAMLRERYGDNRQQLTQETMALYRREKINPFGGCLPILIQIPIFIALYWVLVESVQLRQAPFIFWIQDLSIKDPFYILPILMGITMIIQQRMNPAPPDPTQAKVMMVLPIVFTVLFMNFPAGLVLYWVVNNAISILQQGYIMRQVNSAETKHSTKRLSSPKK